MMRMRMVLMLCALAFVMAPLQGAESGDKRQQVEAKKVTINSEQVDKWINQGKFDQVEQYFQTQLQRHPDQASNPPEIGKYWATVKLARGEDVAARNILSQLLQNRSDQKNWPSFLGDFIANGKQIGKNNEAKVVCRQLLQAKANQPVSLWLRTALASLEAQGGDDTAVQNTLDEIITQHASDIRCPRALCVVAYTYRIHNQYDKADAIYAYVVNNLPEQRFTAHAQRARLLCALGKKDDAAAQKAWDKLVTTYQKNPDFINLVKSVGWAYREQESWETARSVYRYLSENYPSHKGAVNFIKQSALCSLVLKEKDIAQAEVNQMLYEYSQDPELPGALITIADLHRKQKDHTQARDLYNEVLVRWPAGPKAFKAQSMVLLSCNDLQDEEQVQIHLEALLGRFTDADQIPDLRTTAFQLGEKVRQTERSRMYRAIIEKFPNDKDVIRAKARLGQVLGQQGDDEGVEAMLAELKRSHAADKQLAWACFVVGEGFYDHGIFCEREGEGQKAVLEYDKAIAVWERIIEECPESDFLPEIHYSIGQSYRTKARPAMNALYNSSRSRNGIELPASCRGDLEKAISTWDRLLESPEIAQLDVGAEACFAAGDVCRRLGNYKQAITYYEKLAVTWPDHHLASTGLYYIKNACRILRRQNQIPQEEVTSILKEVHERLISAYPDSVATKAIKKRLELKKR